MEDVRDMKLFVTF